MNCESAQEYAEHIVNELRTYGAFIYKVADTGSIYIHFQHLGIGKLRIGDHPESIRYGYRWQLRIDKLGTWMEGRKGHKQFFFGRDKVENLIRHIMNYAMKVEKNSLDEVIHMYYGTYKGD